MPAKTLYRPDDKGVFYHVFNRGIEKRVIFDDEEDYSTFEGFLKEYLSAPGAREGAKRDFTVKGRIFRGVPHLPKNYFGKVELIAYSLLPNHFHLLLCQLTTGSLENFLRSLSTRYSMYFNKKYQRTGPLFEGPYKGKELKDAIQLVLLSKFFHQTDNHSSYKEFLDPKKDSWIKSEIVSSEFDKKGAFFKNVGTYKNFVEEYEPNENQNKALEGLILENKSEHLEAKEPVLESLLKPQQRIPELLGAGVALALLITLGLRNISSTSAKIPEPTQPPQVSGAETQSPVTMVRIKITDGAEEVNIRQEPTTQSVKIGEAKEGDTFPYVSFDSGWYEVKLPDGASGFISQKYIEIEETK